MLNSREIMRGKKLLAERAKAEGVWIYNIVSYLWWTPEEFEQYQNIGSIDWSEFELRDPLAGLKIRTEFLKRLAEKAERGEKIRWEFIKVTTEEIEKFSERIINYQREENRRIVTNIA